MNSEFDKYYEATEPGYRERAIGWATAIGLQDVDGLKPSKYLIATAKRNIEGEITANEARRLVDAYYEVKDDHDIPENSEEADKVAARINQIIHTPAFRLSPEFYLGLHGKIFEGVFPHAGKLRDVDLTKKEWVLNGDTVQYEISFMVQKSLEYDFEQEKKFKYKGLSEDAFVARFASFISGIWQIHPFREGNTRTTAVFAIKYLRSKGYEVSNDLFKDKSFYFRNALVRANYENQKLNVEKTQLPLEEFFKVLIFGYDLELKNRFLRIGQEYGMQVARAVANLHQKPDAENVGVNVGINVGINETEGRAMRLIRENPRVTAASLATALSVEKRHAERIIAVLKKKVGLRRRGSRKSGEWYFESAQSPVPPATKSFNRSVELNNERCEKEAAAGLHKKGKK